MSTGCEPAVELRVSVAQVKIFYNGHQLTAKESVSRLRRAERTRQGRTQASQRALRGLESRSKCLHSSSNPASKEF